MATASMTAEMTTALRTALINAGSSAIGATIPRSTPANVREHLMDLGLIGSLGGLTRTGSIFRERYVTQDLDLLF